MNTWNWELDILEKINNKTNIKKEEKWWIVYSMKFMFVCCEMHYVIKKIFKKLKWTFENIEQVEQLRERKQKFCSERKKNKNFPKWNELKTKENNEDNFF